MFYKKLVVAALALAGAVAAPSVHAADPEWPDDAWLKASTRNNGLHLAASGDRQQWRDLGRVFLKPAAGHGAMRDPHLMRGPDGLFRLVWSTGGQGIAYATSADLVNWSGQRRLPVSGTGAAATPAVTYDATAGHYVLAWTAGAGAGAASRRHAATTSDFKAFGKAPASVPGASGKPDGVLWVPPWLVKELAAAGPGWSGARPVPVPAPAPALDGFTADPAIRVFGDTYYLYPTSDKPHWQTTDFSVWSSKNLVEWKKERMVLDVVRDLKWGNIEAWAPDAIERHGKYYFYFCAKHEIGVASADSPTGPFIDALGKPLLRKGSGIDSNTIDPYPFIDDDGQAYLYYGNGRLANVYKLNQDMISVDGPPASIALRDFREGVVVFKRGGKYYFMWSIDDARSPDYRVGWGVADSPLGPVKSPASNFIVLQRNGAAVGTAHHSIVNVPGTDRWYVAYHRHALPQGGGYQRQTVLARMEFDSAGNITPIDPLKAPFKPGDAGEPIVNGKGLPDRPHGLAMSKQQHNR